MTVATTAATARRGRLVGRGDVHLAVGSDAGLGAGRGHQGDVADVVAVVVRVVVAVRRGGVEAAGVAVVIMRLDRGFDCGVDFDIADHCVLLRNGAGAWVRGLGAGWTR